MHVLWCVFQPANLLIVQSNKILSYFLFYGLIKELLDEITELEKQRDELEAQLKKVTFSLL